MSKEIKLPFQALFKEPMLAGTKIATTRPTRFGRAGDWFRQFGAFFMLTDVYRVPLSRAVNNYYEQEGFKSPEEFKALWNQLHPHVHYEQRPNRQVCLHVFKIISEPGQWEKGAER